jgi:hypothetical protein
MVTFSKPHFGEAFPIKLQTMVSGTSRQARASESVTYWTCLPPNSTHWSQTEALLQGKQATLVNAYHPVTRQKTTFLITNGPSQDTFTRFREMKARVETQAASPRRDEINTVLAFTLPMEGMIQGEEPEVLLAGTFDEKRAAIERLGILRSGAGLPSPAPTDRMVER